MNGTRSTLQSAAFGVTCPSKAALASNRKRSKRSTAGSRCRSRHRYLRAPSAFAHTHQYFRGQAFILRGFTKTWPAYEKWSHEGFTERFGSFNVSERKAGGRSGVTLRELLQDPDHFDGIMYVAYSYSLRCTKL